MRFSALKIWGQAITFFFRHVAVLVPLAPLFVVPFVADLLTAALVAQEQRAPRLEPAVALGQVRRAFPAFVRLKLYYFARACAWGFIPIYGLIREIDERLAWAMSSNVSLLEERTQFADGTARCEDLVAQFRGESSRVLIRVPLLFLLVMAVILALGESSWVFWSLVAAFFWILFPGSAAANTYLYLWIREQEEQKRSASPEAGSDRTARAIGGIGK